MQFAKGAADSELFTSDARAKIFPVEAKRFAEMLNSMSLPVAIIHTNELIERREENGLSIYRYSLNDIGASLFCTVKLTNEDKIAGF